MYQPVLIKGKWQNDIRLCKVTSNMPVIFTAFRIKISNTPLLEKLRDKTLKFYTFLSNHRFSDIIQGVPIKLSDQYI